MKTLDVCKFKSKQIFVVTTSSCKPITESKMFKFAAIVLLFGFASAAPGLYLAESPASTFYGAQFAAPIAAPLAYTSTYAEPATLTKYESISSPLTYTASHQPAVAVTNVASVPLTYPAYSYRYNGLGYAY